MLVVAEFLENWEAFRDADLGIRLYGVEIVDIGETVDIKKMQ